ncbi:MAG: hypothetical protein R3A51_19500 [Nannocystaceae bacterium]|nr:hypothetical protein [Myxococcales bacterium]
MPGPSGALELVYALGSEPWRVEAAVRGVLPRTVRYDDAGSPGGRFGLISGGVRGCPTPSWGRVSFPLCFGLEGGAVLARGVDVIAPTSRVTGWLALVGGVAVRVRLHRAIALVIGVDTLFSLRRPAYHVDGRELLFESSVLGGRALIGIEWIVAPRQRTPSRRSAR